MQLRLPCIHYSTPHCYPFSCICHCFTGGPLLHPCSRKTKKRHIPRSSLHPQLVINTPSVWTVRQTDLTRPVATATSHTPGGDTTWHDTTRHDTYLDWAHWSDWVSTRAVWARWSAAGRTGWRGASPTAASPWRSARVRRGMPSSSWWARRACALPSVAHPPSPPPDAAVGAHTRGLLGLKQRGENLFTTNTLQSVSST